MLAAWGGVVARRRRWVIAFTVAFVAVAAAWGTSVFGALSGSSSLDDPASESQRVNGRIVELFGRQTADVVAIYHSPSRTVDDAGFRQAVEAAAARAGAVPGVERVVTAYSAGPQPVPAMVSADRHATFVAVVETAKPYDGLTSKVKRALREVGAGDLTVQLGGQRVVDNSISDQVPVDIGRAEGIATPILLIALLLVFGSVTAALMPLMVGAVSVLGAFLIVRVITLFTEVSIFSMNIITILGLGLAIDYGLFIVSRFREELAAGAAGGGEPDPVEAVRRTLATAGRTVLVSGLLVSLALSGLLMFPQVFLRSMGFGGTAAVVVAMVTSLTLLPAVLVALGPRIDAGRMPWSRRAAAVEEGSPWWGRVAGRVLRRPVLGLVGVVAVLAVLALPFLDVRFGGVDARMLPAGTESRVVAERLSAEFPGGESYPIRVLVTSASPQEAEAFRGRVADVAGVRTATVAAQRPDATLLTVTYQGDPSSAQARRTAEGIRALAPPDGSQVMVGGTPASVNDNLDSLAGRLPAMALLVAGVTFVLLAIGFGSVLVPLKAIAMNLVSIGAAFGVVTWIFQEGHLSGLLGFTPTGYVEASQPVLMIAILFGLSMDYEVFLLSRIREHWDDGADMTTAITFGVRRTGRMITAAAVLLCIVIGFFATSGITFIKMIGVGMLVAIVVDATLVRLVLVPVTMKLLGRANWWAPAFLGRWYARHGLREADAAGPVDVPGTAGTAGTVSRT